MAVLKAERTTPDVREENMACVIDGHMQSMIEQRRGTGIGLAGDELRLLVYNSLTMSESETQ